MTNSAQYYGSWPYTETYYYSCSTSSTSLTGCSKHIVSSSLCGSNDRVGLWCMTLPRTGNYKCTFWMHAWLSISLSMFITFGWCTNYYCPAVCNNGAVRLVGGASSNEGKVEYCHYGAWSSVCYNFHDEEATVACKQLGFPGSPSKNNIYSSANLFCIFFWWTIVEAAITTDGRFGHRQNFSSFHYFSCSSSASQISLASCSRYDGCGYKCTQNYGIACYGEKFDCFVLRCA